MPRFSRTPAAQRKRFGQLLAALTVTSLTLSGTAVASAEDKDIANFSVTNFTDFHGHLEEAKGRDGKVTEFGAAKLMALMEYVNEGQQYLATSSGDNVGGSAFISAVDQDEPTLEILNKFGLAASAVGNHEFDKGREDLMGRIKPKSNFPILAANVTYNGQPLLDPYVIREVDGVKVALVGTVTTLTKAKVSPAAIEGVEFSDPVEATNRVASELKQSGAADIVVALMHEDAKAYADRFNRDVDILFGGDSHQLENGEIARQDASPLYYAQGFEYGKVLLDADIKYDRSKKKLVSVTITPWTPESEGVADLASNAEVAQRVAAAKEVADTKGSEKVGTMAEATYRASNQDGTTGGNRGAESTLNSLIAEANRASLAKEVGRQIDLGIMNAGGVRADLPAGEITVKDVQTVQPFGNSIAYGTLTGQDILDLLEQQWKPGGSRPRLALGFSNGFSYAYNPEAEQGKRVISATLNGKPVDPAAEYTVATSTFLFDGGDGFDALKNVQNRTDVGFMDYLAFQNYIAEGAQVRTGQIDAGVVVEGDVQPGAKVTFKLSSLNYTNKIEPQAEIVTVAVGAMEATASINNNWMESDEGLGEVGRAEVELTIPTDATADTPVTITTPAGTDITLSLGSLGFKASYADQEHDGSKTSASAGGSAVVGVGAVVALIAAIAVAIGAGSQFAAVLPRSVSSLLENARRQIESLTGIK